MAGQAGPGACPALLLQARDVGMSYAGSPVLAGVDLTLRSGETVAVVGPSGSGKSTLLHCLAGLLQPDVGEVLYEGAALPPPGSDASARLRRRRLGFVFQNGLLVEDLSVVENVALPLLLDGVPQREARARAQAVLAGLGIAELAVRHPAEVSGGEAQRVAIARALVTEPTVVFADEPTGALDSDNSDIAVRMLLEGTRARGAALLLVTHDLAIARQADRVVALRDGRAATA